ncbi:serine hydrolase [Paenibacillus sp. LC231]|uniref:serine hydrolase n=1 Tax=Paenibacillus sp. LC231 TaxID=1120679 RepID=UPI0008DE3852|nr:serine hydrolase [Paenibacillus sp. LC231]OIB01124.1 serine hydrolase [Paenibacillus sp. LC231]
MKPNKQNKSRTIRVLAASVLSASLLAFPADIFADTVKPASSTALTQHTGAPVLSAKEVKAFTDAYFAKPQVSDMLAGALVVVVKDDKVLLNTGYGYADLESKKKIDPDRTLFRMASISKSITATAVMQLVEEGKIDLKQDITHYMPDVKITNNTGTPVTVEHLLTHTTGFDFTDDYSLPQHIIQKGEVPLADFIRLNAPAVVRTPGEVYRYDNLASSMQGYIVERVSGEPFEDYVKKHIFTPLQMEHAAFRMDEDIIANLATGYNSERHPFKPYQNIPTIAPEGGMFATGTDMANFITAHLNKGQFGSSRIMKEETMRLMHQTHYDAAGLPLMSYGFESFMHTSHNGQTLIGKGGDLDGYHSWLWLLPDQNVGALIVVNSDASTSIRAEYFTAFMDHFYPKKQVQPNDFPLNQEQLKKFEGMFRSLRTPIIATQVKAGQGELLVSDALGEHKLTPVGPLRFVDENGTPAAFKEDDNGNVAYMYYTAIDSMSEKLAEPAAYSDVPEENPYAKDIYFMQSLKAFGENEQSTFQPNEPITRAEFVSVISRLAGMKPSESASSFKDMQGHPLAGYVQNVADMGGVTGTPAQNFEPDQPITRQEAAAIIWRVAQNTLGAKAVPAKLSSKPAAWADEAVQFMVGSGMHGPEVTTDANGAADYRPSDKLLRKEAAAIYARLIQQAFGF